MLAQDIAAGDAQSAESDADFFLGDANTELAWLKAHPATSCYIDPYTAWRGLVSQAKTLFATVVNGTMVSQSQMTALSDSFTSFHDQGIVTSC